jgi:uncharacterized protein (TIGR00730 family)
MAKRICVFCSSSTGLDPLYFTQAESFCEGLAERNWELAYGGANVGLMGHFADEALKRKVKVRGAIPKYLAGEGEVVHTGLTELVSVPDLFERKRWMLEKSDAFVVFPGGFGTLDEALEAITWKLLGQHDKPIVFVDLKGFWQPQLRSYQEMVRAGVIRPEALTLYDVAGSVDAVFVALERGFAPTPGD